MQFRVTYSVNASASGWTGLEAIKEDFPKSKRILCAPVERDYKLPSGIHVMTPESLVNEQVAKKQER